MRPDQEDRASKVAVMLWWSAWGALGMFIAIKIGCIQ